MFHARAGWLSDADFYAQYAWRDWKWVCRIRRVRLRTSCALTIKGSATVAAGPERDGGWNGRVGSERDGGWNGRVGSTGSVRLSFISLTRLVIPANGRMDTRAAGVRLYGPTVAPTGLLLGAFPTLTYFEQGSLDQRLQARFWHSDVGNRNAVGGRYLRWELGK